MTNTTPGVLHGSQTEPGHGAGGVIWITGFSGAGKTTVGRMVEFRLKATGVRTVFLDGDDLRAMFANRWGYSREERIELAKVYFRLCSHLSSQGLTVVISAVAMYAEVREWLRTNVSGALEIYLRVPDGVRRQRDMGTKQIYQANQSLEDLYDEPADADLVVDNYDGMTPEAAASKVVEFAQATLKRASDKGRKEHWNNYYGSSQAPDTPSSFARLVQDELPTRAKILEVGCGNGRDSAYLQRMGNAVTAIDLSTTAIEECSRRYGADGAIFLPGTIRETKAQLGVASFDLVYSRFCLHAMTPDEEADFLASAYDMLRPGGNLHIECRSINDPLARKGEVLSPTERIFGHYRRFIVLDELKQSLVSIGYDIVRSEEIGGVAALGDDNPVVIRLVAMRPQ